MSAIEVAGLGKRYGKRWALQDCSLSIPAGHVVALVGPNGAGKTTLLHCAIGLVEPSSGRATVLDGLTAGSPPALDRVAFVAQDAPLYQYLSVGHMIELTRNLNRKFDITMVEQRLEILGIGFDQRVGKLSGGQQSQLALALALARHPELLVLDEPLARLDPLARHEFMSVVMSAVAEEGLSVVLSSHVVSELERVANYLIVLNAGRVQIASEIDELVQSHCLITGPTDEVDLAERDFTVIEIHRGDRQSRLLVRSLPTNKVPNTWEVTSVTLEELILAYLRDPGSSMISATTESTAASIREVTA